MFSPYRPGVAAAEQARIDPFLHNTDARIDGALERPGPVAGDLANRWRPMACMHEGEPRRKAVADLSLDLRPSLHGCGVDCARARRCRSRGTRGRAIASAATSGASSASSTRGTGRADRLPMGAVYEATMRCNLHCEFCYVGDLLNIEGEWRQELTLEALRTAFPGQAASRSA